MKVLRVKRKMSRWGETRRRLLIGLITGRWVMGGGEDFEMLKWGGEKGVRKTGKGINRLFL